MARSKVYWNIKIGRYRFIASTLFHEFVPNRRLTGVGWFGYLWVRGKASREDALRGYYK